MWIYTNKWDHGNSQKKNSNDNEGQKIQVNYITYKRIMNQWTGAE